MSNWIVASISGSAFAMVTMLGAITVATAQTSGTGQVGPTAQAKPRTEVDAAAAQNPISNMISVPFQNNTSFSAGPYGKTQNVLLVEPVIPFHLNEDWSLVTRWIAPVISQPRMRPTEGPEFGLGPLNPQFYFVPANTGSTMIGFGPQFQLPTATDDMLGVNKWGAGPALAALTIQGPWVVGFLANNMWAGSDGPHVNRLTLNPFINYNMAGGWYLSSAPVMTADWLASSGNRWLVPLGGGIGRVFKLDEQPINARVQVFNNVVRPTGAGSWILQLQVQLLFPTH